MIERLFLIPFKKALLKIYSGGAGLMNRSDNNKQKEKNGLFDVYMKHKTCYLTKKLILFMTLLSNIQYQIC